MQILCIFFANFMPLLCRFYAQFMHFMQILCIFYPFVMHILCMLYACFMPTLCILCTFYAHFMQRLHFLCSTRVCYFYAIFMQFLCILCTLCVSKIVYALYAPGTLLMRSPRQRAVTASAAIRRPPGNLTRRRKSLFQFPTRSPTSGGP